MRFMVVTKMGRQEILIDGFLFLMCCPSVAQAKVQQLEQALKEEMDARKTENRSHKKLVEDMKVLRAQDKADKDGTIKKLEDTIRTMKVSEDSNTGVNGRNHPLSKGVIIPSDRLTLHSTKLSTNFKNFRKKIFFFFCFKLPLRHL